MELTEAHIQRYARHILLPDVGGVGQRRLLAATVSVNLAPPIGAASVALAYRAAAGVGTIRLTGPTAAPTTPADVRASILAGTDDIGRGRADAIAARLVAINPDVRVTSAAGDEDGDGDGDAGRAAGERRDGPDGRGMPAGDLAAYLELALGEDDGLDDADRDDVAAALIRGGAAASRVLARIARRPRTP